MLDVFMVYVWTDFSVIEPTSVSAGIEPASVSLFRGQEGTGTNHTQLYIPKQYGYPSGFKG